MHTWFDQYKSNFVPDVQGYGLCVRGGLLAGAESARYWIFSGGSRFR